MKAWSLYSADILEHSLWNSIRISRGSDECFKASFDEECLEAIFSLSFPLSIGCVDALIAFSICNCVKSNSNLAKKRLIVNAFLSSELIFSLSDVICSWKFIISNLSIRLVSFPIRVLRDLTSLFNNSISSECFSISSGDTIDISPYSIYLLRLTSRGVPVRTFALGADFWQVCLYNVRTYTF